MTSGIYERTEQQKIRMSEGIARAHKEKSWGFTKKFIPWNKGLTGVNGNCGAPKGTIPCNKGKKLKELYAPEKVKELIEKNREQAIKNFGKYTEDTSIERKIENWLLFNQILYVKQFKYKYGVADFWLPETNTIIEADGDYYHNLSINKRRDCFQTDWLINNDYNVIRFKGSDIINNFNACIGLIQNAI
jgi:very-short-patch-repair endonuclease